MTKHSKANKHLDPAFGSFLKLLETDIASGRHVWELPRRVAAALRRAIARVRVELNRPLEGKVDL